MTAVAALEPLVGEWPPEVGLPFEDGVLRLWRDGPDFAQRYHRRLSADGPTIEGTWEICRDGQGWRHDFALTNNKVV